MCRRARNDTLNQIRMFFNKSNISRFASNKHPIGCAERTGIRLLVWRRAQNGTLNLICMFFIWCAGRISRCGSRGNRRLRIAHSQAINEWWTGNPGKFFPDGLPDGVTMHNWRTQTNTRSGACLIFYRILLPNDVCFYPIRNRSPIFWK